MNPPPEGWPLVLEFVKALATPTAAVLAVVIAARLALRSFRYQKLLERRIKWYEDMISALINTALTYKIAFRASAYEEERFKAAEKANSALEAAWTLAPPATLYADAVGVRAIDAWMQELLGGFPDPYDPTPEDGERLQRACLTAAETLAGELRRDFRLGALPKLPPIEKPPRGMERGGE